MENFDLTKMTDEQLGMLQAKIAEEQANRRKKKKEELIDTFRKAWIAIEEAGYDINLSLGLRDSEPIHFEDTEIY